MGARRCGLAEGRAPHVSLPLDIRGTAFQQQVWRALQKIPAGRTRSYAEMARSIGRPDAMRAVGSACGANPVALVVPCHRVVQTGGGLGGYRWGVERKRELLEAESEARGQDATPPDDRAPGLAPAASSRIRAHTAGAQNRGDVIFPAQTHDVNARAQRAHVANHLRGNLDAILHFTGYPRRGPSAESMHPVREYPGLCRSASAPSSLT